MNYIMRLTGTNKISAMISMIFFIIQNLFDNQMNKISKMNLSAPIVLEIATYE